MKYKRILNQSSEISIQTEQTSQIWFNIISFSNHIILHSQNFGSFEFAFSFEFALLGSITDSILFPSSSSFFFFDSLGFETGYFYCFSSSFFYGFSASFNLSSDFCSGFTMSKF